MGVQAHGEMGEDVCGIFYQPTKTNSFLSLHVNNLGPSLLTIPA